MTWRALSGKALQAGLTRAEVYKCVLDDALAEMRGRTKTMPQGTLGRALHSPPDQSILSAVRIVQPVSRVGAKAPVCSSLLRQTRAERRLDTLRP